MIRLDGNPVGSQPPHKIVAGGVAIVPEGRRLFTGMTVEEKRTFQATYL
jgi:branched-chain amino acid transport system ATP-binding protein